MLVTAHSVIICKYTQRSSTTITFKFKLLIRLLWKLCLRKMFTERQSMWVFIHLNGFYRWETLKTDKFGYCKIINHLNKQLLLLVAQGWFCRVYRSARGRSIFNKYACVLLPGNPALCCVTYRNHTVDNLQCVQWSLVSTLTTLSIFRTCMSF